MWAITTACSVTHLTAVIVSFHRPMMAGSNRQLVDTYLITNISVLLHLIYLRLKILILDKHPIGHCFRIYYCLWY